MEDIGAKNLMREAGAGVPAPVHLSLRHVLGKVYLSNSTGPTTLPMLGRVCLITGANRGLGKATSTSLARLGATVLMLCRDKARGELASETVRRESGNVEVELVVADLASLASIRRAAAQIAEQHTALHVLVNNAGVNVSRRRESVDGFELTFAVNHLAPFLLTNLLRPVLEAGAPSRIVNVTSSFERLGRMHFEDLQLTRGYSATRAYTQSKLANALHTYELAQRLQGTGVTANCVHPGLVATDLMRDLPAWMRSLWGKLLLTPEKGARAVIHLAAAPELVLLSGQYFNRMRKARSSRRSRDAGLRKQLWRVSARMTDSGLDELAR